MQTLLNIHMRIHTAVPHQDKSIGNQASLVLLITEKKKKKNYNHISSSFNREKTRVNDLVFKGKINDHRISKERDSSQDSNCC